MKKELLTVEEVAALESAIIISRQPNTQGGIVVHAKRNGIRLAQCFVTSQAVAWDISDTLSARFEIPVYREVGFTDGLYEKDTDAPTQ